jgi:hypothetical protein
VSPLPQPLCGSVEIGHAPNVTGRIEGEVIDGGEAETAFRPRLSRLGWALPVKREPRPVDAILRDRVYPPDCWVSFTAALYLATTKIRESG